MLLCNVERNNQNVGQVAQKIFEDPRVYGGLAGQIELLPLPQMRALTRESSDRQPNGISAQEHKENVIAITDFLGFKAATGLDDLHLGGLKDRHSFIYWSPGAGNSVSRHRLLVHHTKPHHTAWTTDRLEYLSRGHFA